jgi:hypothetical protein
VDDAAFLALPPGEALSFVPDEEEDESGVDGAGVEDSDVEDSDVDPPPSPDAAAGVDSAGRDEDPPDRLSVL